MSMSSADKLLSSLTGSEKTSLSKTVDLSKYGQPREYFFIEKRFLGCADELAEQKINIGQCISSREYCDRVMFRYITLLDNATFMPSEHIQKEKEYGITWRTAFKKELNSLVEGISKKLISAEGEIKEDPFEVLHKIVKKDCIDAATFDVRTQADLLSMLIDNLDMLERVVYQVKAMLKEPNQENFEALKLQTVERLALSQQELNPSREMVKEEVQVGEPHIQQPTEVPVEPFENTEAKA